jgi:uncharacterized protein YjbI with pentapeptide repeats
MPTLIIKVEGAFCDTKNTRQNYNVGRISYKNICFDDADLRCANFSQANLEACSFINAGLVDAYFGNANLKGANLKNVTSTKACFAHSDLTEANLESAHLAGSHLAGAILHHTNLTNTNLNSCYLRKADLTRAILHSANLKSVNFTEANLTCADLSGSDLTGADLSGAILSGVNLQGTIGLGTQQDEIAFAQDLLRKLAIGEGKLAMNNWHNPICGTSHCLAGWAFPEEEYPGQKASLKYPTLAQFFFKTRGEAKNALELVALGKLSVFPS